MRRPLLPVFVSAALVVTGYTVLVQFLPLKIEKGQNQGDTNMIRAQDYLAHPDSDIVLVGSSLTFRLPLQVLGPRIANLAMAGGAPATGLALVDRAGAHPKLVLVEVNLLSRGPDLGQVQSLLRFPERQLRASLRAFHTGYDPVNLVERGIQSLLHKSDEDLVPPLDAIRKLIAGEQQIMSHPPNGDSLRQNLAQAASMVSALQVRGVHVGFFEMPIDPSLTDSPAEKALRQAVMRRFPPGRFCWLHLSVRNGAHTLDGIHLMSGDANQVAHQFVEQSGICLKP
jgi:hypothetical protein